MAFQGKTLKIQDEPVLTQPKSGVGFQGNVLKIEEAPKGGLYVPPVQKEPEPSWIESTLDKAKEAGRTIYYLPAAIDETLGITKSVKEKGLPKATFDTLVDFGEAIATAPFRFAKGLIGIISPETAEKLIPETVPHPTELLLKAIGKEDWIKTSKPVQIGKSPQEQVKDFIGAGMDPKLSALLVGSQVIFDAAITGGIAEGILRGVAKPVPPDSMKATEARKILDIKKGANPEEIKVAYYEKAHLTHPDKVGGSDIEFSKINKAYKTLTGIEPKTVSIRSIAYDLVKERPYPWQKIAKESIITPEAPPAPPKVITAPPGAIKPVVEVAPKPVVPPVAVKPIVPAVPPTEEIGAFGERFQKLTPTQKAIYKNKLAKLRKEGKSYDEAKYDALIRAEKYVAPAKVEVPAKPPEKIAPEIVEVLPEAISPEKDIIPPNLQSLAEEVIKYENFKALVSADYTDKIVSKTLGKSELEAYKTIRDWAGEGKTNMQALEDFYTQAVKGVKEVVPEVKPAFELKGAPAKEQALKNIETAEEELIKRYEPIAEKVNEELGKIWEEIEMAEAGERFMIYLEETGESKFIGKDSSFPDWVPERLRHKDLFNTIIKGISDIKNLKYPAGNRSAQRELYNIILDELDSRLEIDTSEIRDRILDIYEEIPKGEIAEGIGEGAPRRKRPSKPEEEEIKVEEIFKPELRSFEEIGKDLRNYPASRMLVPPKALEEEALVFIDKLIEKAEIPKTTKFELFRVGRAFNTETLRQMLLDAWSNGWDIRADIKEIEYRPIGKEEEIKVPEGLFEPKEVDKPQKVVEEMKEIEIKEPKPSSEEIMETEAEKIPTEEKAKPETFSSSEKIIKKFEKEGAKSIYKQPYTQMDYIISKIIKGEPIPPELNNLAVEIHEQGMLEEVPKGKGTEIDLAGMFLETGKLKDRRYSFKFLPAEEGGLDKATWEEYYGKSLDEAGKMNWKDLQEGGGVETDLKVGDIIRSEEIEAFKIISRGVRKGTKEPIAGFGEIVDIFDNGKVVVRTEKGFQEVDFYSLKGVEEDLTQDEKMMFGRLTGKKEVLFKELKPIETLPPKISRSEAIKIVRKYFNPEEVGIKFENVNLLFTGKGHLALGYYRDKMITFIKNPRATIPEHEVVHAYIDLFTSKERKLDVLKEILKRNPELKILKEAEERLADDFVLYVRHEKTFYGKILKFFSDLLVKIKRFFNRVPQDKARKLYDDIIARKREVDVVIERQLAKYREIKSISKELQPLAEEVGRSKTWQEFDKAIRSSRILSDEELPDTIQTARRDYNRAKRVGDFAEITKAREILEKTIQEFNHEEALKTFPLHLNFNTTRGIVMAHGQEVGVDTIYREPFLLTKVEGEWLYEPKILGKKVREITKEDIPKMRTELEKDLKEAPKKWYVKRIREQEMYLLREKLAVLSQIKNELTFDSKDFYNQITKELPKFKEIPLTDAELEAYSYIEKRMPMPENLKPAMEMLKKRGLLRTDYIPPTQPLKAVRATTKRILGTIKPEQIEKIQLVVAEKKLTKETYARLRNGFTGHKRTRIEELSEAQADELFKTILYLTPDKMGKIRLIDSATLEVMKDFIPPNLLTKRAITTGDIFNNLTEPQISYIVSLFRPIRKVLTSGEILPNERKVSERIYDAISLAEEDRNIQYRDWHEKYAELYKSARKEDKNVDVNVFEYIEKEVEVPPKTKELAEFLKRFYSETLPVMKPRRVRQRYITHTAPTFWETVKKIGFRETLKQVVEPNIVREEKIDPGIIVNLEYIVSKEKFNPFALPRSKYNAYSKKLRKSVNAYASLYFYKKNFDPIMPKVLTMNKFLPGSTQKYVKKYLQTVGGRPIGHELWRGPFGRTTKSLINTGVRFEYGVLLGANVPSALGNVAGGTWNNISDIPPDLLALGNKRLSTKQGKKILHKYRLTEQTLWLEPVGGVIEKMSKAERGLFVLMQGGEFYMRGSAALARIPENEFQRGNLSERTRAIIRRQIGRTQGLFGPAQAPLFSQFTLIRPAWMFKHWMVNEMELWNNFVKEAISRAKRNPGWKNKTIGNAGIRKILKYIIIGALFYLFGPEFLKKEMRQKLMIPAQLIATFTNWADSVPLFQDLILAEKLSVRIANQEFREAREDFINWVKTKGSIKKFADLLEGIQKGTLSYPDGALKEYLDPQEAVKRFFLGTWTEKGQKEKKLNEELSKLLPFESYTKWDQAFGTRKVKTDYQKIKEDILGYIEKKKYWTPPKKEGEAGTLVMDKQIERMYAIYNGKALKRLDNFFAEAEKLTGQKIEEKEKNSLKMKITIQQKDIVNWVQTEYEQEIIPRLLRRVR